MYNMTVILQYGDRQKISMVSALKLREYLLEELQMHSMFHVPNGFAY